MARIPYADRDADATRALTQRIVAERGNVLHLYQMLMHSPPIAEGWLTYLTAVRQKSSLSSALRELIIIRVAQLNRAPYEADQHIPIALQAGVSEAKLAALVKWQESELFDEKECAVMAYTDAMTQEIQVSEAVFSEISRLYEPDQVVEITATIAAYNMVSRFLEALQIHSHDAR